MSFADRYTKARALFADAAAEHGGRLLSYMQPEVAGAEGEDLSIDLALIGPSDATTAAVIVTGIHGAEASCGTAVLTTWLAKARELPPDLRLVLIHAANPWGYSFAARTTQANVDLNRNFRTAWGVVSNPSYDLLSSFYHAPVGNAADSLRLYGAYRAFLDQHGWHHEAEMTRGQTTHPDGLYFAGNQPEWANLTLRKIFRDHLGRADRIGVLDIHTGLGAFGEILYLTFAPQGEAAACPDHWWCGSPDDRSAVRSAKPLPPIEGLMCRAIEQELPQARVAGAVLEFGVADAFAMFRSDRLDRWLKFDGKRDPDLSTLRADYRATCTPTDLSWRRLVQREGPEAIDRLIAGLSDWARRSAQ